MALSAVSAAAHASPARLPPARTATASSGRASSASRGRAPCAAQPSAAAASGGIAISDSHVSPSATAGTSATAATTIPIESGGTSDHALPPIRSSGFGMPLPGSATSADCVPISTALATRKPPVMPPAWRS